MPRWRTSHRAKLFHDKLQETERIEPRIGFHRTSHLRFSSHCIRQRFFENKFRSPMELQAELDIPAQDWQESTKNDQGYFLPSRSRTDLDCTSHGVIKSQQDVDGR